MDTFYFDIADNDGILPIDQGFEFGDVKHAFIEAKTVLAEMAMDGLPSNPTNALAVQVRDGHHKTIAQVALRLEITFVDRQVTF